MERTRCLALVDPPASARGLAQIDRMLIDEPVIGQEPARKAPRSLKRWARSLSPVRVATSAAASRSTSSMPE